MANIILKAAEGENPVIVWNTLSTSIYSQTQDAQNWVQENILNTESVKVTETVLRAGKADLIRPISQTYTALGFQMIVNRTHANNNDASVLSADYILIEV